MSMPVLAIKDALVKRNNGAINHNEMCDILGIAMEKFVDMGYPHQFYIFKPDNGLFSIVIRQLQKKGSTN